MARKRTRGRGRGRTRRRRRSSCMMGGANLTKAAKATKKAKTKHQQNMNFAVFNDDNPVPSSRTGTGRKPGRSQRRPSRSQGRPSRSQGRPSRSQGRPNRSRSRSRSRGVFRSRNPNVVAQEGVVRRLF